MGRAAAARRSKRSCAARPAWCWPRSSRASATSISPRTRLQDAVAAALERWPRDGVPQRPAAWLTVAARRRARRPAAPPRRCARRRPRRCARARSCAAPSRRAEEADDTVPDERLRLLFTCCHPALSPEARVALTLRTLGGLSTEAVARALPAARRRRSPSGSSARSARSATRASPTGCRPSRSGRSGSLRCSRSST